MAMLHVQRGFCIPLLVASRLNVLLMFPLSLSVVSRKIQALSEVLHRSDLNAI